MKAKAIIPLVLGLCVGLVAVKLLVNTMQKARGSTSDQQRTSVVRAKVDIGSLEQVTPEMVELVETADTALIPPHERFAKIEDVTDRVTAKAIPMHSPILQAMLAPEGTLPGMKGRIKPGYRAVSVKISEVSGVAYHIKPGDWVDVIVVMDVNTGVGRMKKETIAEVILQHVQVLAIGQTTGGSPEEESKARQRAKSATLLVREENAPKLHLAATRGKITLAMRGTDDRVTGSSHGASESEDFNFGRHSPPQPPRIVGSNDAQGGAGGFLASFLATAARPNSQPIPSQLQPNPRHELIIYHDSAGGDLKVEQLLFDGNSRRLVGAGSSPISRTGSGTTHQGSRSPSHPPAQNSETDRANTVEPGD